MLLPIDILLKNYKRHASLRLTRISWRFEIGQLKRVRRLRKSNNSRFPLCIIFICVRIITELLNVRHNANDLSTYARIHVVFLSNVTRSWIAQSSVEFRNRFQSNGSSSGHRKFSGASSSRRHFLLQDESALGAVRFQIRVASLRVYKFIIVSKLDLAGFATAKWQIALHIVDRSEKEWSRSLRRFLA